MWNEHRPWSTFLVAFEKTLDIHSAGSLLAGEQIINENGQRKVKLGLLPSSIIDTNINKISYLMKTDRV